MSTAASPSQATLTPSQSNDSSHVPAVLAGILVPHIVCTLFIFARAWSRLFLLRKWFLDDTLIVLGWLFSTAVCVVYSIAASTSDIRNALCLCATKLSILAFYLRMFSSRPAERRLAWGTVCFVLLYGIPMLFMSIFQCHPTSGQFFGQPMKCFSFVPLLIASASLHTATDAWLIILIVYCVVRLDLPRRQKIALAVVLSLSVFVIAASMTRLQLSLRANYRPSGASVQVTNTLGFFIMTILECDIALMCASAPTLRPVVARFWPKLGMGEPHQPGRRIPVDDHDEQQGSLNLTVVSYHGYPWTEPCTPQARSKNPSIANLQMAAAMPAPPMPALTAAHRTPTTLSLRSFMSSMAPRSRGATTTGRGAGEDRAVLLQPNRRRSRTMSSCLGVGVGDDPGLELRWANSQESFVLGLNDPASPSRLSPVSDSGFSGDTYATLTDPPANLGESVESRGRGGEDRVDQGRD
ncbi:hypothetical protein GQ53DRAFT_725823 [Thozetella sp. PMI_491]|nr:hypothetical protein GQ53DRAFT_725823 [Thozetella sp. PMI_491]